MDTVGGAQSRICPRGGFVKLTSRIGEVVAVEVQCKTWRCLACRDRVKARIVKQIVYGISTLGRCYFITVTLKADSLDLPTVDFVQARWSSLLSRLKSRQMPNLAWFKIVEATKKGTPHLHLAIGGIGNRTARCVPLEWRAWTRKWVEKYCPLDCIQHEVSKLWLETTGDSFIVDARDVVSSVGAGFYMAKYLTKAMQSWQRLEHLGFTRRWSKSNNWPVGRVQIDGSARDVWIRSEYAKSDAYGIDDLIRLVAESKDSRLLERVGPSELLHAEKRAKDKAKLAIIKGVFNGANNNT